MPFQHSNVAEPLDFLHEDGFVFVQDRLWPAMIWLHTFLQFEGYRESVPVTYRAIEQQLKFEQH